jgi:WD40 repeat protein
VTVLKITDIIYSVDGRFLITGDGDWKVKLWDPKTLQLQQTITLNSTVVSMQGIRNSSLLVVGTADRQVALVDLAAMQVTRRFSGLQANLSSLAVSPDGTLLAAGDINGGIATWNTSGAPSWKSSATEKIPAPKDELLSRRQVLLFSQDGKTLFSGLRSGSVRVFDAGTGEKIRESEPITYFVSHFEYASDGSTAIFQTSENTIRSLDVNTGRLAYTVTGTMLPGNTFSSNGRYFAPLYDSWTIRVYESASGKVLLSLNGNFNVLTVRFLVNDSYLGAWNGSSVRIWSLSSGQEIKTIPDSKGEGCKFNIFSPDNKFALAYVTPYDTLLDSDSSRGYLCKLDVVNRTQNILIDETAHQVAAVEGNNLTVYHFYDGTIATMTYSGEAKILHMAINPDGTLLAAALADNSIHIWSIKSRAEIIALYGHDGEITDLHFANDGKLLVSSSSDGTIRLWGIP